MNDQALQNLALCAYHNTLLSLHVLIYIGNNMYNSIKKPDTSPISEPLQSISAQLKLKLIMKKSVTVNASTYPPTWHHMPEDCNVQSHCHGKFKS
jgi:hypothetical protein